MPRALLHEIDASGPTARRASMPAVLALSFAMTVLPVVLHIFGQPLALAVCVMSAIGVAMFLEADTYIVVLFANVFQNLVIVWISPHFTDIAEVEPLKIYSVVTAVVVWAVAYLRFWTHRDAYSPFVRRLMDSSSLILVVFAVYFVLGVGENPRSATIYMRNLALPIFLLHSFLLISSRSLVNAPRFIAYMIFALSLCGYMELFAGDLWLSLTNGDYYFSLFYAQRLVSHQEIKTAAAAGVVVTSYADYTSTDFLNTPLLADWHIRVQRLLGPNFHPISYGYLLAILIAFAAIHRRIWVSLLALPLLIMTNAKGPLILALLTYLFHEVARRRSDDLALKGLVLVLFGYAAFVFRSGVSTGDFHVLGLLGGVNGFLQNPIGHSLAEGGNLSVADFSSIDWSKYQHQGSADIAVESAVGVMLYQLGVASFAVLAFYAWLIWTTWRLYLSTRAPALAFAVGALATTLVNGLFQEEAYFAPLSLGLVLGLTGLSLGATDRAIRPRPRVQPERRRAPSPVVSREAAALR